MANPTRLRWRHDGLNTDGSAFNAAQFRGWELEINGEAAASVPAGWETDGEYEVPLANFAPVQVTGEYAVRMRLVNANEVASEWSTPFTFAMDFRTPSRPFGLTVA